MLRLGQEFDHLELQQVLLLPQWFVQIYKTIDTVYICMHALQHLLILVVSVHVIP